MITGTPDRRITKSANGRNRDCGGKVTGDGFSLSSPQKFRHYVSFESPSRGPLKGRHLFGGGRWYPPPRPQKRGVLKILKYVSWFSQAFNPSIYLLFLICQREKYFQQNIKWK